MLRCYVIPIDGDLPPVWGRGRPPRYAVGTVLPGGTVITGRPTAGMLTFQCGRDAVVFKRTVAWLRWRLDVRKGPIYCRTCQMATRSTRLGRRANRRIQRVVTMRRDDKLTTPVIARCLRITTQRVSQILRQHLPGYAGRHDLDIIRRQDAVCVGDEVAGATLMTVDGDGRQRLGTFKCTCGSLFVRKVVNVVADRSAGRTAQCRPCVRDRLANLRRRIDDAAVMADYDAGMTWKQICARNNISSAMVGKVLLRNQRTPGDRSAGRVWDLSDHRRRVPGED